MSENNEMSVNRRRRDAGFTLPELLVSIIVLGSIVAVLSSAIIVTFRQKDNTEGRLNVTRAEQNVGMWIPADLASTGTVPSTDPNLSPCSATLDDTSTCPPNVTLTGSNALFLSWTDQESIIGVGLVTVTTNVSYHFTPRADGTFDLMRIACRSVDGGAWTCEVFSVLTELPGPPDGNFIPGVTVPSWVLIVSVPLAPDSVGPDPDPTYVNTKNANRVVVTINGGGDADGGGGGINQISLTAGGTTRSTLPKDSTRNAPTFTQTQSRCGGPLTLIIDDSGSIGSAMDTVKNGVRLFIESLAGTPVQIQIVRFDNTASVLGTSEWSKYFDMTVPADVTALAGTGGVGGAVATLTASGATNWEDAWFHTFYAADGTPAVITPNTVVFFTDGIPTQDRILNRGGGGVLPAVPALPGPGWFTSNGSDYSQVAFNRADYYATERRAADDTRLVGVGVGPGIGTLTGPITTGTTSEWMPAPRVAYNKTGEERTTFVYQERDTWTEESHAFQAQPTWLYWGGNQSRSSWTYWSGYQSLSSWAYSSNLDFERGTFQSRLDFEQRVSGSWVDRTPTQYYTNNVDSTETDNWRIRSTSNRSPVWYTVTQAENQSYASLSPTNWQVVWADTTPTLYNGGNVNSTETDGWRIRSTSNRSPVWYPILSTEYTAYNSSTPGEADGYRKVGSGAWVNITKAAHDANNYTADETDGYRSGSWWTATSTEFDANNTVAGDSDGWRKVGSGAWVNITKALYDANNYTADETDGYRTGTWQTATKAVYDANNTVAGDSDGWRKDTPSGTWATVSTAEYTAYNTTPDQSDGYRINGWQTSTQALYAANNTTFDESDGWRRHSPSGGWVNILKPAYDAQNTTQDSNDGFRRTSPSGAWVSITEAEYNARNTTGDESDGVRPGPDVLSPSGSSFYGAVTQTKRNAGILARLISGNFNGEAWTGALNTNERVANMFVEPNWALVPAALKAVALGECGGTLTLQTKVGSTYATDAFEYQNTAIADSSGNPLTSNESTVITNSTVKAVTFDFDMADGLYRTIEIEPLDSSDLLEAGYTGGSWSCKAGVTNRPVVTYPIPGTVWTGVRVQVGANEAVSCIHSVTV